MVLIGCQISNTGAGTACLLSPLIPPCISRTTPGNPLTGNLVFYQNMIPPLSSDTSTGENNAALPGSYSIKVEQIISSEGGEIPETTNQNVHGFVVRGPKFSLPEGAPYSVYPPEEAQGEYGNVMAHACFTSGTLPWERRIGKKIPQEDLSAESDQAPWLGILLAYDTDPEIKIEPIELTGLVNEKVLVDGMPGKLPADTFYPEFSLEFGEKSTDKCLIADIPINLFNKIAPCYDDLPWLGHRREIRPSNKQSAQYLEKLIAISTTTSAPRLSTVICNWLPVKGAQSTAYLVSLESWGKYLPDRNGRQSSALPTGIKTIRMVLLKQWQFYALARNQTFAKYLLNLNKKEGAFTGGLLQLPTDNGTSEADKAINNAFNMGYVPLDHLSKKLFYEVQDVLNGNKRKGATKVASNYMLPLEEFLECPLCNRTLAGSASKGAR